MAELADRKIRYMGWAFLVVGVLANICLPHVALFYANYVERAQDWSRAISNTIHYFVEYPKVGKAYLEYNLHLTGFGVISMLLLRVSAISSIPANCKVNIPGLIFAGITVLLATFIGYVGMFMSRGSTSGLAFMFIPFWALLSAVPAFIVGWLWGRLIIKTGAVNN